MLRRHALLSEQGSCFLSCWFACTCTANLSLVPAKTATAITSASASAQPADQLLTSFWRSQVDKDLREMLVSPDAPAAKKIGVRVWPRAIPQFNVGHQATVQVRAGEVFCARAAMVPDATNFSPCSSVCLVRCVCCPQVQAHSTLRSVCQLDDDWRLMQGAQHQLQEAGFDGCLLGGNYVAGVALGKCVEYAYEYAGKVASYLENSASPALATSVPVNTQQDSDAADTFRVAQN